MLLNQTSFHYYDAEDMLLQLRDNYKPIRPTAGSRMVSERQPRGNDSAV